MRRLNFFKQLCAMLRHRPAGVAVIVALMTPVLIAMTGLSVGVGYWYQQQESLQSAADAAALSATLNYATLTGSSKSTEELAAAVSAANIATNNQFGFATTGNATIALTPSTSGSNTLYTATAQIPRTSFFTKSATGLFGIGAGTQSATATAELKTTTTTTPGSGGGECLYSTSATAAQAIYASGGARINASGCSVYVNSTACNANNGEADAIVADPSAAITASTITTQGCIYANTNGGAYVGGANNDTSGNTQHAAAESDPLASMGTPPPWPTMPNTPVSSATSYTSIGSNLGYNTWSSSQGDCTYMGSYTANCELYAGNYSGMTNLGVASLLLNKNTSSGTTSISGGFSVNANNFLTLNGSTYNVAGGMSLTTSGTATLAAGNYNILGGTTLQNGSFTIGAGTSYFSGASTASGTATTWGLNVSTPSLTVGAGTYYFNGGAEFPGSNPTVTFGQGTYLFSTYSGGSNGALNDNNANITFTGGTYFFDGGLTVQGNGTVTFGPGIYYIRNGQLDFTAGSHVTANSATFVLEGTASYQMDGGSAVLNVSAPTSNCVAPSSYPVSTYSLPSSTTTLPNSHAPYDGTNGEGICGVLIYQARGDSTADTISEGANSTVSGIIYAPSAALSVTGGATISAAETNGSAGTLAFIQSTYSLTGSGTINISVASNSPIYSSGSTTTTTTQSLLIN